MAGISLMVTSQTVMDEGGIPDPKKPRARFVVERDGIWMDGDIGLNLDWKKASTALFSDFTSKINTQEPIQPAFVRQQCKALYKLILPQATKDIFASLQASGAPLTLLIYSDPVFDDIPWELLHDGSEYFGVRFRIARMPIVLKPPAPSSQPRQIGSIYHVLGKGVLLPNDANLFKTWVQTFGGVPAKAFPTAPDALLSWPTLEHIEEACGGDILHLTCHGLKDGAGWALDPTDDASVIREATVEGLDLKDGRPLIFANACQPHDGKETQRSALATKFVGRGTLNLIGTFAPVSRNLAIQFAAKFYELLLTKNGDVPIGEALRLTKKHFHDLAPQTYDPSYLFYCLYGPANSCFQLAAQGAPAGGL